jgi:outer membrane protein assembly factor BamB
MYFDILPFADLILWENSNSCDVSSIIGPKERLDILFARNFYDFGGDSMSGVMASWRLRERFGDVCASKDVLQNSIIRIAEIVSMDPSLTSVGIADKPSFHDELPNLKKRRFHSAEESAFSLVQQDDRLGRFPVDFCRKVSHNTTFVVSDKKLVSSLKFEWQSTMSKCVDSSPLLVFDVTSGGSAVVYVGSHAGDFCCFDANSGKMIWKYNLGGHMEGSCALLMSREATSASTSETTHVLACAYAGNDVDGFEGVVSTASDQSDTKDLGLLCCLNAASGSLRWRRTFPGEIKAAPCVDNYLCIVYVACYDHYLYAVDGMSGVILGKVCCHGSLFSCPVLLSSQASATKKILICVTTQGSVLIIQSNSLSDKTHLVVSGMFSVGAPIFARPLVVATAEGDWPLGVIVGAIDGSLRYLSISREPQASESPRVEISEVWKLNAAKGALFSSPCLVESPALGGMCVIFGSHDGRMRCVEVKSGVPKWETDLSSSIFASPVCVASKHAVLGDGKDELICFVCTTSGYFVVLDALSGSPLRSLRLPGEVYGTVAVSASRPDAFVGCRDNRLHCIRVFEDA